jgi:hypothetical protein
LTTDNQILKTFGIFYGIYEWIIFFIIIFVPTIEMYF